MSDSSITRASIRQLILAYASMFCILILLLIAAQTLVQVALAQESHARAVAAQINAQELRTQRMFYNVLLLQNPTGHGVNYLATTALVEADEPTWEAVQMAMYSGNTSIGLSPGDFSADATSVLNAARPDFFKMEAAYRHIFALEQRDHPASPDVVRPDVNTIFIDEAPYLDSLISLYSAHSTQADQYVQTVRLIEIVLFVLSALVVLPCEAFFVARPAVRHLREHLQILANMLPPDEKKEVES